MATNVGTLQAKLRVDFKEFTSGIDVAIGEVRILGQEIGALGQRMAQSFSASNKELVVLSNNLNKIQGEIANYKASMLNNNTNLAQTSNVETNSSLATQMERTLGTVEAVANAVMDVQAGLEKTVKQVNNLSAGLKKSNKNLNGLREDVGVLGVKMKNTTRDTTQMVSALDTAKKKMASLSLNNLQAGFQSANKASGVLAVNTNTSSNSMKNLSGNMQEVNTTMNNTSTKGSILSSAFQQVNGAVKKVGSSLGRVKNMTQNTASAAAGTTRATDKLHNNYKKADREAQKLAQHTKSAYNFARDLKRIIAGIVISQTFYALSNLMQTLVTDSYTFMKNMEYAGVALKYLTGSKIEAGNLMQALQDFAVESPLDTDTAVKSTRMLMNMGFQAEGVVTVLRTLTDGAAVAGEDMNETLYSVTLAIGQILQAGKLKAQEVRQLYDAGIPIFSILQEELGLTEAQIQSIGDQAISGSKAVAAILNGLNRRYAGASLEMQQTVLGATSAIKDSFSILFSNIMAGPYELWRTKVVALSTALQELVTIVRTLGIGGVFEKLVPPQLQAQFRNVIGAVMQLGYAFMALAKVLGQVTQGTFRALLEILNLILPPITIAINAIAQLLSILFTALPGLKYFLGFFLAVSILLKFATGMLFVAKSIGKLFIALFASKWMALLTAGIQRLWIAAMGHPVILLVGSALLILASRCAFVRNVMNTLISKIKELWSYLTGMNKTISNAFNIGYNPGSILTADKKAQKDTDKYNASLEQVIKNLKDTSDAATETQKKIKQAFNQSFDEVYNIIESTSDDLGLGDMDLDLGDIDQDLGDLADLQDAIGGINDALKDIGTFNLGDWLSGLFEGLDLDILDWLRAALWGLVTGLLTKSFWLGLLAGAIGLMWDTLIELIKSKIPDSSAFKSAIEPMADNIKLAIDAMFLALALKKLLPAVWDATGMTWKIALAAPLLTIGPLVLGEALLALLVDQIGGFFDKGTFDANIDFWDMASKLITFSGNTSAIYGSVATAISQLVRWTQDALLTIGVYQFSATGSDNASIFSQIGKSISEWFSTSKLAPYLSLGLYTLAAFIIQSLLDFIGTQIKDTKYEQEISNGLFSLWVGAFVGIMGGGPLGGLIAGLVTWIVTEIASCFAAADWDWDLIGDAFALWGDAIKEAFMDVFVNIFSWEQTKALFQVMIDSFNTAIEALKEGDLWEMGKQIVMGICAALLGAAEFIVEPIQVFFEAFVAALCAIFGIASPAENMYPYGENIALGILEGLGKAIVSIPAYLLGFYTEFVLFLSQIFTGVKEDVAIFTQENLAGLSAWWLSAVELLSSFVLNTKEKVNTFVVDTKTSFATWKTDTLANISSWASEGKQKFADWRANTASNISSWKAETSGNVSSWSSDNKQKFSDWWANTKQGFNDWWITVKGEFANFTAFSFSTWISNTKASFQDWASSLASTFSNMVSNATSAFNRLQSLANSAASTARAKINSVSSNLFGSLGYANGGISTRGMASMTSGHANGGIYNREHWARFAEGGKAEAIIPLENDSAMQPFVSSISNGLISALAPLLANNNSSSEEKQPIYVGTLIADEKGLKELERKMKIIRASEERRS